MWPTEPMEQVQVVLTNDGHPMDAEVELWLGPDTPCRVKVKSEHGKHYAFSAVLETQPGSNTIAVNNNGPEEHPFAASVAADNGASPQPATRDRDESDTHVPRRMYEHTTPRVAHCRKRIMRTQRRTRRRTRA